MASLLEHTVMPSGGDFTNIPDAIAHIASAHPDLVGDDVYAHIKIDGTWSSAETAIVTIPDTILTDATRYLKIYTTPAARHSGKWNTGAHIINVTGSKCFYNNYTEYLYLDGLQMQTSGVNGTGDHPFYNVGGVAVLSNCIIRGDLTEGTYAQYGVGSAGGTVYVINSIIYDIGPLGYSVYNSTGTMRVYSVTGIGGLRGIRRSSGTVTAKNCYFGGSADADYYGTITKTNCASEDETADGTDPLINKAVNTTQFANVSAGTEDFHLAGTGSALYDTGVDTSGESAPLNFTTDIDGDTRSRWDIGADEYTSGAPSATNVVYNII